MQEYELDEDEGATAAFAMNRCVVQSSDIWLVHVRYSCPIGGHAARV